MWSVFILAAVCAIAAPAQAVNHVFCYYDSKSYVRETQAKMLPADLNPALSSCTHLVYGYAGILADSYKIASLNENLDLDQGHGNYRTVTNLKRNFPGLKIILSVGGGTDVTTPEKYKILLEDIQHRTAFINSAILIAKNYGFDGVDLSWQFPETKPKRIRSTIQGWFHSVKKWFGSTPIDDKADLHREGFTALVREFRNTIRNDHGFLLTHTVLPNVNCSIYHNVQALIPNLDAVILSAFDFATPTRNPYEADYTAPIYPLPQRNPPELYRDLNVEFMVDYWLKNGAPGNKIILGIATFARAWKMTTDSQISGVPPVTVDGPALEGPYTKEPGLFSYPEVCTQLNSPNNVKGIHTYFRKVTDPSLRSGTFAYRLPDANGERGQWVSYEDPETAGNKANYARAKNLGGVAIIDLSLDDFKGLCTTERYPILKGILFRL